MICLDTNAAIAIINDRIPEVSRRFEAEMARGANILLPILVVHELWFGVVNSARPPRNAEILTAAIGRWFRILDFDADDAHEAGRIRVELKRAGTPIGPYDLLIAAQARRRGAVLVTGNGQEFGRVPGLRVEDWAVG
jgi:tRNA(fMet)-specific endonuclease VapC